MTCCATDSDDPMDMNTPAMIMSRSVCATQQHHRNDRQAALDRDPNT